MAPHNNHARLAAALRVEGRARAVVGRRAAVVVARAVVVRDGRGVVVRDGRGVVGRDAPRKDGVLGELLDLVVEPLARLSRHGDATHTHTHVMSVRCACCLGVVV